jgi:hypothetical protein
LGVHLREALDRRHIGALHGGFGGVTPTLGGGRTGLQIVELLFDVDDILDDVSAAVVGALDFVSEFVAFGFGLLDARLEFVLGHAELVVFAREGVSVLAVLLARGFEFGTHVVEFVEKALLGTLFVGFEGVTALLKPG